MVLIDQSLLSAQDGYGGIERRDLMEVRAVEDSERLIELVRGNGDISNHADGCSAATIAAAEAEIGVGFPPSYRRLIEEFGTWDVAGEEFLGVYQTAAMGTKVLGSVAETLDARRKDRLPADLIVVMFDGMGGLVVLDTGETDEDGEWPVLVWNPGVADRDSMDRLGESFGSFALARCQRAVASWRTTDQLLQIREWKECDLA